MPFQIIRNDITRVKADAIVNTANPRPRYASGTDAAIYQAAGAEELLAERKKIGDLAPGEAAVTPAFALPAKYIIHTVGPAWVDGHHGEFEILRSCYRKSLRLADQLGCESIAFPLIATGVYGFPKDLALETALSVIREHLETSELNVILVVFGRGAYQLAAGLTERVEEYIDEQYVAERRKAEYGGSLSGSSRRLGWHRRRRREQWHNAPSYPAPDEEDDVPLSAGEEAMPSPDEADMAPMPSMSPTLSMDEALPEPPGPASPFPFMEQVMAPAAKTPSLEEVMKHLGESFQQRLFRLIDERGMTDPQVYKRANLDRKLFSKIRCSEDYIPKKKTIVALAIALRLNLDDTKDLLASAGLALTSSSKSDVIVRFCIENEIYDIFEVNALLFRFGEPVLG